MVGPEGGIAPEEIAALTEAGAVAVRLGPQVLRTSTAAAVALGALGVLTPRWEQLASPQNPSVGLGAAVECAAARLTNQGPGVD